MTKQYVLGWFFIIAALFAMKYGYNTVHFDIKRGNSTLVCESIVTRACGLDLINCDGGKDYLCQKNVMIIPKEGMK